MAYKVLVTPRSFGRHSNEPDEILKRFGVEVKKNPYSKIMTEEQMIEEIKDVDGIIVGVDPLSKEVLQHAEKLKVISKYGVGIDNIDISYAKERNIKVARAMNANADAVADYTFALMMAVARKVVKIDKECRKSNWKKITTIDVHKKTLGLVGLGNIGKKVAQRAKGFEMDVLAYDLMPDYEYANSSGVQYVNHLDEIFLKSDFISLHLPLNKHTEHIISKDQFKLMKSIAVIVNTARGGLIDEQALSEALQEQLIWGAGIDVFESEPPQNKELLGLDNIVIGSHCAASTVQAIDNMGIISSENLVELFEKDNEKA
ncbi:phosphoglycerate dehydrogenase [Oceanobacillus oncorhynchi]|uniref:phosphoglycerate dehydrogenase n=1 Tax=Oceanobacillus oncorhynchi TaxID=545501 RepID=UPI0034D5EB27